MTGDGEHRIGSRELRRSLSAMLARAGNGERIVVTVDGRPLAQLAPLDAPARRVGLDQLAAAGLLTPPRRLDRAVTADALVAGADVSLERLIDMVRGVA